MAKKLNKDEKKEVKKQMKKEEKKIEKKANKELKKKEKKITNEVIEKKEKPKKSIWKKIKITFIIIFIIAAIIGIALAVINIWMPVKQTEDTVKFSEVKDYCDKLDKCDISELLFDKVSYLKLLDIELKEVTFDIEENEYELIVWAYGTFGNLKEYRFDFKIKDDEGPYIEKEDTCIYYIGEDFDINKCLNIRDYSDGKIKIQKEDVDYNDLDLTKVNKGKIKVKVTDEDDNEEIFEITLKVRNLPISSFKLDSTNAKEVEANKSVKWTYTIKPSKIEDKTAKWTSEDESIATVDDEGNIKGVKKGTTKICAISNYDKDQKDCEEILVKTECKSSYSFELDSTKSNKLVAGEDFCPGTYRIYADSVKDYYDYYYVRVYKTSYSSYNYYSIEKSSSYYSDEGREVTVDEGGYIELEKGILKFRLEKVK